MEDWTDAAMGLSRTKREQIDELIDKLPTMAIDPELLFVLKEILLLLRETS